MKKFFKNNIVILFLYVIALVCALSSLLNYDKISIHVYLNQLVGNKFLNIFFYYITYLGDGLIAPFILLAIVIYNVRVGVYTTISFLSATITSQILKQGFFDDVNRPEFVFKFIHKEYSLTYVEGVERFIHNSFPSGHATQAFSIFLCLAFVTKNQYLKLLLFFLALFTALSRVYLSQHWLSDITAGSAVGVFFSILFYHVLIIKNKFEKLNKPLSALKKS